jgi:hypothetical protein
MLRASWDELSLGPPSLGLFNLIVFVVSSGVVVFLWSSHFTDTVNNGFDLFLLTA